MSIPGSAEPLLLAQQDTGGYQIERSLRFNSSDSAYLSRTPASAGNRKTWTWAAWVKRSGTTTDWLPLFQAYDGSSLAESNFLQLTIYLDQIGIATDTVWLRRTQAVYRDYSAWMHVVCAFDTTQATGSDRVKIYVNGSQVTAFAASSDPTQNADYGINRAVAHQIGQRYGGQYFDGYLADVHFIDGQALDPTSFTEVDATTGQLIPKAYTGTYGTNGFHLPFSNNSTAAALGTDTSGNSNTWTVNNISVAAGSGNDSLVDTPTSYGTDTGAGSEVRGNYATLNPLHSYVSLASNGNLDCNSNGSGWIGSTIHVTTGKWYVEFTVGATGTIQMFGVCTSTHSGSGYPWQASTPGVTYYAQDGRIYVDGVNTGTTTASTAGDIISLSFDVDAKSVVVRRNNSILSTKTIGTTSSYMFFISDGGGNATSSVNFGQRQWAYAAPAGFKALCDTNLPAPVVAKPSTVMDVKLYTGNGGTQTISGLGFSPDLVWGKERSGTSSHVWMDVIRGAGVYLRSDLTNAESANANVITSFDSSGFTLGTSSALNGSGNSYVAWTWDAGSSTVANNDGSITSQARANPSAGFSVVTYTGNGTAGATVGHGLGVAPQMVIVKCRDTGLTNWRVYHSSLGATKWVELNSTSAAGTASIIWNNTAPTSTVFSLGTDPDANGNTRTLVAYCFAPVAGYSSFGSYTGNGSADGPFVYTGMLPRWIMVKRTDSTGSWVIWDAERSGYNAANDTLAADSSNIENALVNNNELDILSNGFKLKTTRAILNASAGTYIYAAFAEHPFQYARAR